MPLFGLLRFDASHDLGQARYVSEVGIWVATSHLEVANCRWVHFNRRVF